MKKIETIKDCISMAGASAASLVKVLLMSRRPSAPEPTGDVGSAEVRNDREGQEDSSSRKLIIMGNGPSLRQAIDEYEPELCGHDLLSVNFAPLAEDFKRLRPKFHLMADGVFFDTSLPGNVGRLWEILRSVDWPMILYVPARHKKSPLLNNLPSNIRIKHFNLTPVEGWQFLRHWLYGKGLGMPRPRNVLIPSIMTAIREGYKEIGLIGADHSWSKTLWVTDTNRVVSVQPHFYKDNEKERERVESVYKDIKLFQIYESFAVAFRSYFLIAGYAEARGALIFNCTPGSFIDAFPRISLAKFLSD